MLRHNLLIIYRNFKRHKSSFFINLIGLSTGLTCALLIYLWVNDEWHVDKFHSNDRRLFQVVERSPESKGGNTFTSALLAESLKKEFPEIELAVSNITRDEQKTLSAGNRNLKAKATYASEDFFKAFTYPLVQGNGSQALSDKNAIVLSEKLAFDLFQTTDNIIGKTVEFEHQKPYQVTGVFKAPPANASAQFDFVLAFDAFKDANPWIADWTINSTAVYVVLKKDSKADDLNSKLLPFLKSKRGKLDDEYLMAFPYSDGYLYGFGAGGRIEYVRLFSIIAIFILFIACINFMNLSTARASRRLKEVGIKKAIGAGRKTLICQYLGESLMLSFLSLLLSIVCVFILLPQFNEITGKHLLLNFNPDIVIPVLAITIFTGIIAGSYPALYLSGFDPVSILKGKLSTSIGEVWARKGLVVFQFAVSVILIVAVVVVYKQIAYVQSRNPGYNKENILYLEIEGKVGGSLETFLSEIKNIPGIISASSMGQHMVGQGLNMYPIDHWEGKRPDYKRSFEMRPVNYDLLETLDIKMAEGRSFSKKFSTEDAKIIFNEAAISEMGLKNPIGKTITIQGMQLEIIGVAKNFHFASLHEPVGPLFFVLRPEWTNKIMARIDAGKQTAAIQQLQQFYQTYNPGFNFHYKFLDEDYQTQYAAEQRVAVLSRYFAGTAIMISCLGLFALAAFTAERRNREIGIRKVVGASNTQIVRLLSAEFSKTVLIAIFIAVPVSYLLVRQWLNSFAYHIELTWWYFLGAGLSALIIAWITVGMQAIKAAVAHPIKSLRTE